MHLFEKIMFDKRLLDLGRQSGKANPLAAARDD
jgi:hypothetical protein